MPTTDRATRVDGRNAIVSIELLFDAETESSVRADWDRLAAAGLSSAGAHPSPSNRPHVTLMVRPRLPACPFTAAVAALPFDVTIGDPIVFRHGDRGVLARSVLPSARLTGLHEAVHAAVPHGDDAAHTAPGSWTPHITLARRLRLDDLEHALGLLGPTRVGRAVSLRRWDSEPALVTPLV